LRLLQRVAVFLGVVGVLHLALAPLIPLAAERRHFAVPVAWGIDWLLFVRPRLPQGPAGWKRFRPALVALAIALGVADWLLVVEGARRGGGWSGAEEWVWKGALSLSLMAHWSLLARAVSSTWGALRVPARPRVLLTALATTLLLAPYGFTVLNVHRVKSVSGRDPSAVRLRFEPIRFASGPLQLRGWWIPAARPTSRCVVVCHGISANMGAFVGVAPFLHRAGFNVLFFDFRGHGASPGHTASFGWHESEDVRAACKYLRSRGQDKIALYGFSMGGAAVNLAFHPRLGAVDEAVRAVVVDSTFARFPPLVEQQLGAVPQALRPSLMSVLSWCSLYEIGVRPEEIVPAQTVARIAPRPLLIIHGDADRLIPVAQSRELFAAARSPKQRIVVPGAGHCLCRLVNPGAYEARVANWLRRALR
jgi:alpha-beta hydrolase superfamily lysophospholipase